MKYRWDCLFCDWRSAPFVLNSIDVDTDGFKEKERWYDHVDTYHTVGITIEAALVYQNPIGVLQSTGQIIRKAFFDPRET